MSALVIFTGDVERLACFYELVLGLNRKVEAGDIRLTGNVDEVLIHSVTEKRARDLELSSPTKPREQAALKPAFDVASLQTALAHVTAAGGSLTKRTFTLDGLTRHDVVDPDGNVIQLRSRAD